VKSFIVHDSDGIILKTGLCAEADFSIQAGEGQHILEGTADDSSQMIVDGQIVDKPELVYSDAQLNNLTLTEVRSIRFRLLTKSDWTQMLDSQLTDAKKAEWATYRQALRDIPETHSEATSLDDIIWPTEPE